MRGPDEETRIERGEGRQSVRYLNKHAIAAGGERKRRSRGLLNRRATEKETANGRLSWKKERGERKFYLGDVWMEVPGST